MPIFIKKGKRVRADSEKEAERKFKSGEGVVSDSDVKKKTSSKKVTKVTSIKTLTEEGEKQRVKELAANVLKSEGESQRFIRIAKEYKKKYDENITIEPSSEELKQQVISTVSKQQEKLFKERALRRGDVSVEDVKRQVSRAPTIEEKLQLQQIRQEEQRGFSEEKKDVKPMVDKVFRSRETGQIVAQTFERPEINKADDVKSKPSLSLRPSKGLDVTGESFSKVVNILAPKERRPKTPEQVSGFVSNFKGIGQTSKGILTGAEDVIIQTGRDIGGGFVKSGKFLFESKPFTTSFGILEATGSKQFIEESIVSDRFRKETFRESKRVKEFSKDPQVQTFAVTAGLVAGGVGAFGTVGKIAVGAVEVGFAAKGLKEIASLEPKRVGAGLIMAAPLTSRIGRGKRVEARKRLAIEENIASVKLKTSGKDFTSKTTESFIPFETNFDVIGKDIIPVTETIRVVKKPSGFDVPTTLTPRGKLKPELVVRPEAEVVFKPKQRQLTLIQDIKLKEVSPFAKLERTAFTPESIGISELSLFEKAKIDVSTGKQFSFRSEFNPIPERVKRLSLARGTLEPNLQPSFSRSQTTLNIFKGVGDFSNKGSVRFVEVPRKIFTVRVPSQSLFSSKRGSLGRSASTKLEFDLTGFSSQVSRFKTSTVNRLPDLEIVRVKSKPLLESSFPIITNTGTVQIIKGDSLSSLSSSIKIKSFDNLSNFKSISISGVSIKPKTKERSLVSNIIKSDLSIGLKSSQVSKTRSKNIQTVNIVQSIKSIQTQKQTGKVVLDFKPPVITNTIGRSFRQKPSRFSIIQDFKKTPIIPIIDFSKTKKTERITKKKKKKSSKDKFQPTVFSLVTGATDSIKGLRGTGLSIRGVRRK